MISSLGLCRRCAIKYNRPSTQQSLFASTRSFSARASLQQQFSPLVPPNPASLPKPKPVKHYKRSRRWIRRLVWTSVIFGGLYYSDKYFYASSLRRTLKTFGTGLLIGLDYKVNFRPHPLPLPFGMAPRSLEHLHTRNAERVFDLLGNNGGLYLKIGQAVAMNSAVLPPQFQQMFARMFDDAPQNSWADVEQVIREEFGKSPEEVFGVSFRGEPGLGVMERTARASASVAQVHYCRTGDGREVAIKVQKREIEQQVGWDLWTFKVVAKWYTWWFDIPVQKLVPGIADRLMTETDFENEARNSEEMKALVEREPRLRDKVYIPKVHWDLTRKRVMTAEWIEGVPLRDKETIGAPWKGGWRNGTPGCHGVPFDAPGKPLAVQQPRSNSLREHLKPDRQEWRGRDGKGGLGLSMKDVMGTMVDLFSAQMFLWGTVHCDPHPGNIIVRRKPSGKPELVLIDHGLYIRMRPEFRHQYALFWKSLMAFDNRTITEVVKQWGVNAPDMFASMTLMRPYEGGDKSFKNHILAMQKMDPAERRYAMEDHMRKSIKDVLGDMDKFPQELLWIGRNMRIVQANNQLLGSPVNRVKIMGTWASRALVDSSDISYSDRWRNFGRHILFRAVMFGSDLAFWFSKIRQRLGYGEGMEDDLEKGMKSMMKGYGVELNHSVFDG